MRNNFNHITSTVDGLNTTFGEIAKTNENTFKIKGGGKQYRNRLLNYIYAETLLYTAHKVYNRAFTIDDVLTLFSGVYDSVLEVDISIDKLIVQAHTILNSYRDEWQKRNLILDFYFKQTDKIVTEAMMFSLEVGKGEKRLDGKISFNPNFKRYEDRIDMYENLLNNKEYIDFIDEIKSKDILTPMLENRVREKQSYSISKKVNDAINSINDDFVRSLEINTGETHYLDIWKKLKLEVVNPVMGSIEHIAGPTGVGKSVLYDIYIKKLVDIGLKVLYVTDSHTPSSINSKEKFDKLGIKSTIVMGKDREKHMNSFIKSKEGQSTLEVILEHQDLFNNIDFTCSNTNKLRCNKCDVELNVSTKGDCGFFEMYKRLESSDVVITTPHNLLSSPANRKIDNHRRRMYEILSVWADVIIFDEVDKLQEIADDIFVGDTDIFSFESPANAKTHLESFMQLMHKHISRADILKSNNIKKFNENTNKCDNEVNMLQRLFFDAEKSTEVIRGWVHEREFSIRWLIDDWSDKYVSSLSLKEGHSLDSEQFNRRIYALLSYKIDSIRKEIIDPLIEKYDDDVVDIDIDEIYEDVLNSFVNAIKKMELKEEELDALKMLGEGIDGGEVKINFKHTDKKNERNEMLTFILLVASIDKYLSELNLSLAGVLDAIEDTNVEPILTATTYHNHLLGVKPLIHDAEGFKLQQDGYRFKLNKKLYLGIGREILFNNPRAVSRIYDIEQPYMFLTSATGTSTGSSLYTIKYPVNYLLKRNDREETNINVECHIFYDSQGLPISVSGTKDEYQASNLKVLAIEVADRLIKPKLESIDGGILVGTTSYKNVDIILKALINSGIKAKGLYHKSMGEYDPNIHIQKIDIVKEGSYTDVFVAVYDIINRGYNILDSDEKSYFTDIIMMNRKMPSPNDSKEKISYLHNHLPLATSYKSLKSEMYKTHNAMRKLTGYSRANSYMKGCIGGNTFTSMKQFVGRGQRGGTTPTLYLVDSAFYPKTAEDLEAKEIIDTKSTSLFKAWQDIVDTNDNVVDYLYSDIKHGLNNYKLIRHEHSLNECLNM